MFGNIQTASATSLDDIYRDIVRDNNSGYLPIFVRNRNRPELLFDEPQVKTEETSATKEKIPVVNLTDERKIRQEELLAAQARWQAAKKAIQENNITPKDLKILDEHVAQNDAQAVEIKAWMYAKGRGVKADLIKSFRLYRKAEKLGVPDAKKNAAQVYRAMNREQRESLASANKEN